jgi:phosphoribosylformylglycinamidine synthase
VKAAVLVFPGSNCDRDLAVAFRAAGAEVAMAWHKDIALPAGTDIVGVPGGFAWGDYLRCGAIAARAPIIAALRAHVERGGYALGVCNGFQVLTEVGLLPGALIRNAGLRFVCRTVALEVATTDSAFTTRYVAGAAMRMPVAHHDGNFVADAATLDALEGEDRVAFRYGEEVNGSARRIAGILSGNRRVLGLMPHPERAAAPKLGLTDGAPLFRALADVMAAA